MSQLQIYCVFIVNNMFWDKFKQRLMLLLNFHYTKSDKVFVFPARYGSSKNRFGSVLSHTYTLYKRQEQYRVFDWVIEQWTRSFASTYTRYNTDF